MRDPNTNVRGIHINARTSRTRRPAKGGSKATPERDGGSSDSRTERAYHHGDLPAALADAALELVAEKGVHGFSVSEVARRVGVSSAAPYRHYASREHLLAAVALRGYREVAAAFAEAIEAAGPSPADRLAACAGVYVRFAGEHPAMFEVLFAAGLDKSEYPELRESSDALIAAVWPIVTPLTPNRTDDQVWALIQAVVGLAHGYAALLLDGALEHFSANGPDCEAPRPRPDAGEAIPPARIDEAESRVIAATRALLRGRSLLFA